MSAVADPLLQLFVVQQEVRVVVFDVWPGELSIVVPGKQLELHDHVLPGTPFKSTHVSVWNYLSFILFEYNTTYKFNSYSFTWHVPEQAWGVTLKPTLQVSWPKMDVVVNATILWNFN